MIKVPEEEQTSSIKTAKKLKGSERRIFIARGVQGLGRGGQRYVEQVFGWNRRTVRKGSVTAGASHLDRRLSTATVRRQLIEQKAYSEETYLTRLPAGSAGKDERCRLFSRSWHLGKPHL